MRYNRPAGLPISVYGTDGNSVDVYNSTLNDKNEENICFEFWVTGTDICIGRWYPHDGMTAESMDEKFIEKALNTGEAANKLFAWYKNNPE